MFPDQVVIVPIWKKDGEKEAVLNAASSVKDVLQRSGIKVKLDDSDQRTPGWKFNFWEMKVWCKLERKFNFWDQIMRIALAHAAGSYPV